MPRFEPFPALRYAPGIDLDAVLAPPYDVLSGADVDAYAARDAHNIVHVDVPRGGPDRYDRAGALLRRWVDEGILVRDESPTLTIYRTRFTDEIGAERDLVSVLGALEVVDEGAGGVLPHERTTPKASTDRYDLTAVARANLSPVWGLSLATGLTELLREPGEPLGEVTVGGVTHVVERLAQPHRVAAVAAYVAGADVLIADGHHRYGVARRYRDAVRQATGSHRTPAELTLALIGELVAEQVSVAAIHRLYRGLPYAALREVLSARFDLEPAPDLEPSVLRAMDELGRLVLVGPDGAGEWLVPKPGTFSGGRALDGAWLETALSGVAVDVEYQHGLDEVVAAVTGGRAEAGVLIRPVSIAEIERTAREGLLMPPKSTFFTPKPRTGVVVRELAG